MLTYIVPRNSFAENPMSLRLRVTDAIRWRIEPLLKEIKHPAGSPPKLGDRMFLEAILYQARTGNPWRDLPRECGDWNAVHHRFRRWEKSRVWEWLWQSISQRDDAEIEEIFIDSTIVRAHKHAAGAEKNGGQNAWALGRSRGGFSTKLHAACADERTGGERHDAKGFELLWPQLAGGRGPRTVVMDKAYDSDAIWKTLAGRREKVERFFNKINHFGRIATRYDKLGRTFLAFVHIVSAWVTMRQFVNTA